MKGEVVRSTATGPAEPVRVWGYEVKTYEPLRNARDNSPDAGHP